MDRNLGNYQAYLAAHDRRVELARADAVTAARSQRPRTRRTLLERIRGVRNRAPAAPRPAGSPDSIFWG